MGNENAYSLGSVDNALRLLLMLQAREKVRVTEVARELGVVPSTAHRLLAALCTRGFAERDDARVYRAGPALGSWGWERPSHDKIRSAFRPYLERLRERTGETVHLMVRDRVSVIFLDGIECAQILRVGLRTGRVLPAHCTSGGKALLADLPPADLTALYPHGLPEWPDAVIRDLPTLRRRLAVIRQQGFAVNNGESEAGITAVGVCLRAASGHALGAVTVAAPDVRGDRRWVLSVGPMLAAMAGDVSPAL